MPFKLTQMLGALKVLGESDLKEYLDLNARVSNPPFVTLGDSGTRYKQIKLSDYKQFYITKFKYDGAPDDLDFNQIEEWLWILGRVAVVRLKDGSWVFGSYTTKAYNHNDLPTVVEIFPKNQHDLKGKLMDGARPLGTYKVGENVVLFQASTSYYIGDAVFFTPYNRVNELLEGAAIANEELIKNTRLARTIWAMPRDVSPEELRKVEVALHSGKTVIPLGDGQISRVTRGTISAMADIRDRTKELIQTEMYLLGEVEKTVGCDSNAVPDKRAQQNTDEIRVNNSLTAGINNTELSYRQKAVNSINKIFGLNITVGLAEHMKPVELVEEEDEEANDNAEDTAND